MRRLPLDRDVEYKIEPTLHREMVSLIRSVHTNTKSTSDQTDSAVKAFLRSGSPPLPVVESIEVPIFPRSSWPGHTDGSSMSSTKMPRSMSDLRCLAPTVQIEEEDLSVEHMRVVDGWSECEFHRLLDEAIDQGFSGLPRDFIATANPLLRAGRYFKSGG